MGVNPETVTVLHPRRHSRAKQNLKLLEKNRSFTCTDCTDGRPGTELWETPSPACPHVQKSPFFPEVLLSVSVRKPTPEPSATFLLLLDAELPMKGLCPQRAGSCSTLCRGGPSKKK